MASEEFQKGVAFGRKTAQLRNRKTRRDLTSIADAAKELLVLYVNARLEAGGHIDARQASNKRRHASRLVADRLRVMGIFEAEQWKSGLQRRFPELNNSPEILRELDALLSLSGLLDAEEDHLVEEVKPARQLRPRKSSR